LEIISAIYWRAGLHNIANPNSIMLKIAKSENDTLLLALICTDDRKLSEVEIASDYATEEMTKWFNHFHLLIILQKKSINWIKKSLIKTLQAIHDDLSHYDEKNSIYPGISLAVLAIWRKKHIILQFGEANVYKFKRLFSRKQGILLCSNNFITKLSKSQIDEALRPSEFCQESQITKRLAGIADYVRRKGEEDGQAAIYVKF